MLVRISKKLRRNSSEHSGGRTLIMEHRWGARSRLNVPVQIDCGTGAVVFGVLRDASVSGAFVYTAAQMPAMTVVRLLPISARCHSHEAVEAYVVRWTPEGCGLEWSELAPAGIVELMYLPDSQVASTGVESGVGEMLIDTPEIRRPVAQEDVAL
jgi:hypothetical protein